MTIKAYVEAVSKRLQSGISREHSYRGDLETLIRTLVQGIEITNEPANVTDCGNPDYVITKGKIPVGYIEAKDIGKDLNSKSYKEQFGRYKKALDNLIITDYIWFQFFQNGELVHEIKIGEIENNSVKPIPENFSKFENLIKDFATHIGQTIKSSKKLAEMMAGKARLLQDILERAITSDEETQDNTSLKGQYDTFRQILIHDLKPKDFADIYAQTLAYGMFAARLHDPTLDNFSRQEAAELIPKSNPFLRKLFGYIAGPDIDERMVTVVDNLAEVFRATNVEQLLKHFGKATQMHDPIIHFYETFLAEYDPKLRKARGVWYTPEPVVNFIVRAVDDILKTEFNLPQGLADTSKTKIKINTDVADKRSTTGYKQIEKEVHKVQLLDPATGTGTFLAEVVKFIYNNNFKAMKGAWSGYVEEHLIPRLNGFELLMASYAMAHLKLDMLLTETGYKSTKNQRLNIYLTNSLEEHHKDTGTLFSNWLSSEANEANHIKRDTPVMCVIGNPPYSGESANKGKWIMDLMQDYKKEPGGKEKLKERNPKAINDDYVKFIRYSQHYIEKNGSGILAFINPHGFLDNPTFRGMRWHLLKTYDKIYTIDLHGNSKKKEICPDGSVDENVFDIMQGVAITFFIKTTKTINKLAEVYHYDLYGKRNEKYKFLNDSKLQNIKFNHLPNIEPMYFMVEKDFSTIKDYQKGFLLSDLFIKSGMGIATGNDKEFISINKKDIEERFEGHKHIKTIDYRLFDKRHIYYDNDKIERGREKLMFHLLDKKNIGLISLKRVRNNLTSKFGIVNHIVDKSIISTLDNGYVFPLYQYVKNNNQKTLEDAPARTPNLNPDIVNAIAETLGLAFVPDHNPSVIANAVQQSHSHKEIATSLRPRNDKTLFTPLDLLDYIYAVLHSPTYRETYKEFLKIDFPRVPYPKDVKTFWNLVALGSELRQIHLLETSKVEEYITSYDMADNAETDHNVITTKIGKNDWKIINQDKQLGRIWINESKYFNNIPLTAWEFYIGGYQPAQKWLKDRRERELNYEDILHYQKIIVALTETDRLMTAIDAIDIE